MSSLRVKRNPPRGRDEYTHLSGRVAFILKTLSKTENEHIDSFLHVGTGFERLWVSEKIPTLASEIGKIELQKLAMSRWKEILGEKEYATMATVGNKPVIPGSSIKGNIRARMELSFVPKNGEVRSCFSVASMRRTQSWRHRKIWRGRLDDDRGRPCSYDRERTQVCLLCDIFGAQGLASLVELTDAVGERVQLKQIDGEYDMKLLAAPPGSIFTGEMSFRNLRGSELGLIFLSGMRLDENGRGKPVLLGRLRYKGMLAGKVFGRVKYEVKALTLSRWSNPLRGLLPGETASGATLRETIQRLIASAEEEFRDELDLVDEVAALEGI